MENKRKAIKRSAQLFDKLNKFVPAYKILAQMVSPFRGLFDNDYSKVGSLIDHKQLIRSHATHAVNIFASGLNSGMTNKASQWFRPTLEDIRMLEVPGVRAWLDDVRDLMHSVINGSNLYDAFFSCYMELGTFGTGCYMVLQDVDDVVRARSFTAGEYMIGVNHKGVVDTFGRQFEMTVRNCVDKFGKKNCSAATQAYYEQEKFDVMVKVELLIQPNKKYVEGSNRVSEMKYESLYWEKGTGEDEGFLEERGMKVFRVVAPRWEVITTDTDLGYGVSWHALGSIKEMQKTAKDKLMAQNKLHDPPTIQDSSVDGHANTLPGGTTKVSGSVPNTGVRPAYQINPNLDSFIQLLNEEKDEIDKFFFVNLFLAMIGRQDYTKTATEVASIEQEKMMMIGPALHRLDYEMHTPTLEIVYHDMLERGMIPQPPPEIEDFDIKMEYTSILAQAQQAVGITKIERVIGIAERMVGYVPSVAEILDADQIMREVSEMEGAPAKTLRTKEDLKQLREAQAAQAQKQQQAEALPGMAKAAKDASDAKIGNNSALDKIMEQSGQ